MADALVLTPAFASIAGGWFEMGSELGYDERPLHRVFVDAFELGVYPVTRADYEAFLNATRHEPPRDWALPPFARANLPVVGVSWLDAVAYCTGGRERDDRLVRARQPKPSGEFAARGRRQALFPWGDAVPEWIPNDGRGPLQRDPGRMNCSGTRPDFGLLRRIAANCPANGRVRLVQTSD